MSFTPASHSQNPDGLPDGLNNQPAISLAQRTDLKLVKRIVIKLGTQVVVEANPSENSPPAQNGDTAPILDMANNARLQALVLQCAELIALGKEIIIVSSGAVGLGRQRLGLKHALSLIEKQACAAVGQNLLMDAYQALFSKHGLLTAQVLLTALDFADRRHYLNLRQTLETLLQFKVIPIINENDSVSTMELQEEGYTKGFGDNDRLSALVAGKLDADLLVILTNVDGIYTENPSLNSQAKRLPVIESLQALNDIETLGRSTMGRGGMASKLEAARIAAISGLPTLIVSGLSDAPLTPLLQPEACPDSGTLVLPWATSIRGKKHWIGLASGYHGVIIVNDGACHALLEKRASLLPVGISAVQGDFDAEQVVSIHDERGNEIGRGLTYFSSADIAKIQGLRSEQVTAVLEDRQAANVYQEVIHRDNLVIFQEYGM